MIYRDWNISLPDAKKSSVLAASLGLPRLVCEVLVSRGMDTDAKAREFITSRELPSPLSLANMEQARDRILKAVDKAQRIAIFGDYDVDGVTATALVYIYLDSLGADVVYRLPSREGEGYGLSATSVDEMQADGVELIVTVDNGISAHEVIAHANELGIDVVLSDHHLPQAELPKAYAIVDPHLAEDTSGLTQLSGVGVAFMLICAIEGCEPSELLDFYGDLVAIGTVGDMMPLTSANRVMVHAGLEQLSATDRSGLAALIAVAGLEGKELSADNISFGLAPRLNSAGRMDSAYTALELLLCDDIDKAHALARTLQDSNLARQETQAAIVGEIIEAIAGDISYNSDAVIVVSGKGYHQGVIGIVASHLVEHYAKPAIVISIDEDGVGKGSGRSIEGISLHDALSACSSVLTRYGGHAMAAGLSIEESKIAVFRQSINAYVNAHCKCRKASPLNIDVKLRLDELSSDAVLQLGLLAPFGAANPQPVFLLENMQLAGIYPVSEGRHTRLRLAKDGKEQYAVMFGVSPEGLGIEMGTAVDAVVSLSIFNGKQGPMISSRIVDIRPSGMTSLHTKGAELYAMLLSGAELSADKREALRPEREFVGTVYRLICTKSVPARDLRSVFALLGEKNTPRILVAIQALEQLGLVGIEHRENSDFYVKLNVAQKKNLADALVLRALED